MAGARPDTELLGRRRAARLRAAAAPAPARRRPIGFRRVRDAYEFVLRALEARAAGADADEDAASWEEDESEVDGAVAEPPAPRAAWVAANVPRRNRPAPARPRALAAPLRAALARARESGRQRTEARVLAILARALRERRGELDLGALVLAELAAPGGGLRKHLRPADVHGAGRFGTDLMRALLLAHVAADDWPALWAAVHAIESVTAASTDPAWLHEVGAAIEVVALIDVAKAERLADVAFRRAPPDERAVLGEADGWIQAGKQLGARTSADDRQQLVLALCNPAVAAGDPVATRALAIGAENADARVLVSLLSRRFPTAAEALGRHSPAAVQSGRGEGKGTNGHRDSSIRDRGN